ncbi:perlucin-like protein [Mercenaria mercenaria]|uniref:perlucin-like protein n=1 Tax=Mercenaria mercenaria TaxID=6596 RepID=UPI00234E920A|nr:perlucin-like protein [Mercenaria mercenaria]
MSAIQLLVLGSALLAAVYSACPSGWRPYGGNCYMFQKEIQTWADARFMCKWHHNSDLITIETQAEQDWFKKQALTFNYTEDDDGFWLGATDWENQETWIWEPTKQPMTYKVWGGNPVPQPNNRNGSENCLAAVKFFDFLWSDEFCNWQRVGYVCEMAEPTAPVVG